MKKLKKILTSPITTVASFILAAGLLLFSSIGGAQAALTAFSENYVSEFGMNDIGVALLENDKAIAAKGALLSNMLTNPADPEKQDPLMLGRHYREELKVQNTGTIGQYVRVSIYRYWMDANDKKDPNLSPGLIGLLLLDSEANKDVDISTEAGMRELAKRGWLVDVNASTPERMVLYYNKPLAPGEEEKGEETPLFAEKVVISGEVARKVSETSSKNNAGLEVITRTYAYNGYDFCLEVKVDAVQDHNVEDAVLSAWGRKVSVDDGILSLQNAD